MVVNKNRVDGVHAMFEPDKEDEGIALSTGEKIVVIGIGTLLSLYAIVCLYKGVVPSVSRSRGFFLIKGNAVFLLASSYLSLATAVYSPLFTWRNSKLGGRIALGFFLLFVVLNVVGEFYTDMFGK